MENETNCNWFTLKDPITDETLLKAYVYADKLNDMTQVHLETKYEVYDGPINFLNFSESGETIKWKN